MNKKVIKIIVSIILFIIAISTTINVKAVMDPDDIGKYYIKDELTGGEDLKNFAGKALGIIQTVGIVLSVIILSIVGIKYMLGSASERAEYKRVLLPYVIGAIILFSVTTIANIVYQFATKQETTEGGPVIPEGPPGKPPVETWTPE